MYQTCAKSCLCSGWWEPGSYRTRPALGSVGRSGRGWKSILLHCPGQRSVSHGRSSAWTASMLWCRFSTASLISSSPRSEVLSVADFFDHLADAPIPVDLMQEILRGDEAGIPGLPRRVHLLLQSAAEDFRDLRAAHAAHRRQHRAVVDLGEEGAPRRRLGALASQLQDLLLTCPVGERHL